MTKLSKANRRVRRGLALAGLAAGTLLLASTSGFAGECPAGKAVADGKGLQAGATAPKGVTDTVIGDIDLAGEAVALQGHELRLRRLTIEPGGVVPWHSHGDRPAIIYVVQGEVTEYASTCAVPILHRTGDATEETQATSHWWKNTGKTTAVLLSADILHDPDDAHTM